MQKTFTVDYLTHKTKKNEGEKDQFFIADHHDAIVSREIWEKTQEILEKMKWKSWIKRRQQRLKPQTKGILAGYIPVGRLWKEISVVRLVHATQ